MRKPIIIVCAMVNRGQPRIYTHPIAKHSHFAYLSAEWNAIANGHISFSLIISVAKKN